MLLHNSFLGPFQTTLDGNPVHFESDKTRALLAYLVIRADHPHRRDALASLFWPDQSHESALKNLRQTLYRVRQALGEGESEDAPFLLITSQAVQFNPKVGAWLDVAEFRRLLAVCAAHKHRRIDACPSCHARFLEAAQLYRGDLLSGFVLADSASFDEWLLLERESLHEQALLLFEQIGAYAEAHADYAQALLYARRQLEFEPWREEAHRQAMLLLLEMGQKSAAVAQYEACRRVLEAEFGIEPGAETQALYRQILGSPASSAALPKRPPDNLPTEVTPFLGREDDLLVLGSLLESAGTRLVTLVGPGGVGKTRLALQAARAQVGCFADGVFAVPLQQLDSPDGMVGAVAQAVGLNLKGDKDPQAQMQKFLADKEMLIVLDNLEHLLPGAGLLSHMIAAAPNVVILATSREPLNLHAEIVFDVEGLLYPQDDAGSQRELYLEGIADYAAVQLFVARAQRVNMEFSLNAETAPGVAKIISLLSGLPLGIEIAASWTRQFTPAQIARSVAESADFLQTSFRDMPAQHSSLRAVFDYSWRLLSPQEQSVLAGLSVFRGGSDLDAAQAVTGASEAVLQALSNKSLVTVSAGESATTAGAMSDRYSLHEVVRQYASEKLQESDAEADAHRAHALYYLRLAEQSLDELTGPNQNIWLDILEREHDNLRAALTWVREREKIEDIELGLRAVGAMWRFWERRSYFSEGQRWLESLVAAGIDAAADLRGEALRGAGLLAIRQGNLERAAELAERSVTLYRQTSDKMGRAGAISTLGNVRREQGDHHTAEALYEQSLALYRELDDDRGIAVVLNNLGATAQRDGNPARASELFRESLVLRRASGDTWGVAYTLSRLGEVTYELGNLEEAEDLCNQSLALMQGLSDKWGIALAFTTLGNIEGQRGNYERNTELLQSALSLYKELGEVWGMATTLRALGTLSTRTGEWKSAARFYRQSLSLFRENGDRKAVAQVLADLSAAEGNH